MRSCLFLPFSVLLLGSSLLLPSTKIAQAAHPMAVTVRIFELDGTEKSSFELPLANQAGGVVLTVADLGNDGTPEILAGNGLGNEPRVRVLRADGSEIGSFLAYAPDMGSGLTLASCDLNGDGFNEIITGTQYGGGPHVRVFDRIGEAMGNGFFAYDENFRGGVSVACGDVDGDGEGEIITVPGPTGGPHVRVWSQEDGAWKVETEWFAGEASDTRGLLVAITENQRIITATQKNTSSDVHTYVLHNGEGILEKETTVEINASGVVAIGVHAEKIFLSTTDDRLFETTSNVSFRGKSSTSASSMAFGNFEDGKTIMIVSPTRPLFGPEGDRSITIDLSEQRLYAYEHGILANTFLISAARKPWETPIGIHQISAKLPFVNYRWSYGPGDPRNYDLGLIPWNLRFYPHIYIHYAPWHNNFGHPMSHGCVNVNLANSKWIYTWAEEGTVVEVRT